MRTRVRLPPPLPNNMTKPLIEQKRDFFKKLGYEPFPEQWELHADTHRIIQIAGGERASKSWWSAYEAAFRIISSGLAGVEYWLVAADYIGTQREFEYLWDIFEKLGLLKGVFNEKSLDPGTLLIGFKNTPPKDCIKIVTKSAGQPTKLRAVSPAGIVGCEFSQADYETYMRCRGRLVDYRGWFIISGCLTGDSLIATDAGVLRLDEVEGLRVSVSGISTVTECDLFWDNGASETRRIVLDRGMEIEGTPDHRVIARKRDGSVDWVSLDNLDIDTLVAIRYGIDLWGRDVIENPYLVGLYIAEGCCDKSHRFTFTNGDKPIQEYLVSLGFYQDNQRGIHFRKTNHGLARYYESLGIDLSWKATTKQVPLGIRQSQREDVIEFLQGLFDGDGSATDKGVVYYTSSKDLARQVQVILLNLGIMCSVNGRLCKLNGKEYPSFSVNIADAQVFADIVGFKLERKQIKARQKASPRFYRNQASMGTSFMGYPVVWARVLGRSTNFKKTYDLHVPNGNAYWANGLIVHNTFESSLGWYAEKFKYWQSENIDGAKSYSLPSWVNRILYPGGREDPEIIQFENTMSRERFMERHGGEPCPPAGGVVSGYFSNGTHVRDDLCVFNPEEEVLIWVDPGYAGACAVEAVQKRNDKFYVFDEIFESGLYTPLTQGGEKSIIGIVKQKDWFKNVSRGTIDIAGESNKAEGPPIAETWRKETGVRLTSNRVLILDGIEMLKTVLMPHPITNEPRIYFHSRCKGVISEMGGCPNPLSGRPEVYSWKTDREGKVVGLNPIDRYNHAIKAVSYGIVDEIGYTVLPRRMEPSPPVSLMGIGR